MIAGNATPIDARTMWNPSVNAIWLRAGANCEAAARRTGSESAQLPTGAGSAGVGSSSQSMRAASERSSTCGPWPDVKLSQPQAMNASMRLRTPVISAACTPSQAENAIDAVQLVAVRADLGDRGAAADHGHDALVVVVEGLARLAGEVGEHVLRRAVAALQRDRAELRDARARRGAGMLATSPTA